MSIIVQASFLVVIVSLVAGLNLREQLPLPPTSEISEEKWNGFIGYTERFSKNYGSTAEAIQRFHNYHASMQKAMALQAKELGTAIYGETGFSDFNEKELKRLHLSSAMKKGEIPVEELMEEREFEKPADMPENYDCREHNLVTAVKEQICGDCWSFSITANVEGQWARKTGKLVNLSESQLDDCNKVHLCPCKVSTDCEEGPESMAPVFKDAVRMGGMESLAEYPYGAKVEKCQMNATRFVAYVNDSKSFPEDETKIAIWLYKNGPVSVAINCDPLDSYTGGIIDQDDCNEGELNHAVLLVGYGVEKSAENKKEKPYWIIKNSWGTKEGEKGYYRIARGKNMCHVSEMATTVIVD